MPWYDLQQVDETEQIDDPSQPLADLTTSMTDVARTNRWFGGVAATLTHVARLAKDQPSGRPLRILDIGTGSADIPIAVAEWGRRRDLTIEVTAVDNLAGMLAIAKANVDGVDKDTLQGGSGIRFVLAEAGRLPFAEKSFDIVTCALMFHHIGFERAAKLLASMDRLSTIGFVASDLRRDAISLMMVDSGLRMMRAHPITRNDGPVSVRRAYTVPEYRKMVAISGVDGVEVYTHWYYRVSLVKSGGHSD